jgi:hypothetical protein
MLDGRIRKHYHTFAGRNARANRRLQQAVETGFPDVPAGNIHPSTVTTTRYWSSHTERLRPGPGQRESQIARASPPVP